MPDQEFLAKLQAENARPIALLETHGIDWRPPPAAPLQITEPSKLSTGDKVALFRRLFRGRSDVYPVRWKSKTTGKSGSAPACGNEWRPRVCEKPFERFFKTGTKSGIQPPHAKKLRLQLGVLNAAKLPKRHRSARLALACAQGLHGGALVGVRERKLAAYLCFRKWRRDTCRL